MSEEFLANLKKFLVEAKLNTYAGGGKPTTSSRKKSVDLPYRNGDYFYLDSYLGSSDFIGEEVVWYIDRPVWGMNYYGKVLIPEIPEGFSDFLKLALSGVEEENPYRGPKFFKQGDFGYKCSVEGGFEDFRGEEYISHRGMKIYKLYFHGGVLS